MSKRGRHDDWFTCPVCGEQVRADALACPSCGADDETGWAEDAEYAHLDFTGQDDEPYRQPRGSERKTLIIVAILLSFVILLLSLMGG